jgi:hypothetical protein
MKAWYQVVYSKTEDEFEEKYAGLKSMYSSQPALCEYLDQYQYPQREEVAFPWSSRYPHFGNTVTLKLEATHGVIKRYLENSRGDLDIVVLRIKQFIDNFIVDFKRIYIRAKDKPPHHVNARNITIFEDGINDIITPAGLEKVVQQWDLLRAGIFKPACTGSFETVFGVPCCHTIRDLIQLELKIRPEHFHHHWYFKRPGITPFIEASRAPTPPQVLPPAVVHGKGRPHKDDNTTRRLPSRFERNAPSSSRPVASGPVSQVQVTPPRLIISQPALSVVTMISLPVQLPEAPTWQAMLAEKIAKTKARRENEEEDSNEEDYDYFSATSTQFHEQMDDDALFDHIDNHPDQIDLTFSSHRRIPPPRAQFNFTAATVASKLKAKSSPRTTTAVKHQAKVDKARRAVEKAVAQADKAMKAAQLAQNKLHQAETEVVSVPGQKRCRTVSNEDIRSKKRRQRRQNREDN